MRGRGIEHADNPVRRAQQRIGVVSTHSPNGRLDMSSAPREILRRQAHQVDHVDALIKQHAPPAISV